MKELPEMDNRVCAKNSGIAREQTLQVARRNVQRKVVSRQKETILGRHAHFLFVLLQMDLSNVVTWKLFLFE